MFADDAKCLRRISHLEDMARLQEDLNSLDNWSIKWKLSFKVPKCVHLRIGGEPEEYTTYKINNTPIPTQSNHKDLDVLITSTQTWSDHISMITGRAYKILGLLRRTFSSTNSVSEKKLLYV